jgi:fucose permease
LLDFSFVKDEGLGSISLGVLYISLTLFSAGAPVLVKRLGSKYGILVGLIGYWIFMLANLSPSW